MDNSDGISCEWGGAARIIVSFGLLNGEEPFILAAEGQNERFLSGRICESVAPACSFTCRAGIACCGSFVFALVTLLSGKVRWRTI